MSNCRKPRCARLDRLLYVVAKNWATTGEGLHVDLIYAPSRCSPGTSRPTFGNFNLTGSQRLVLVLRQMNQSANRRPSYSYPSNVIELRLVSHAGPRTYPAFRYLSVQSVSQGVCRNLDEGGPKFVPDHVKPSPSGFSWYNNLLVPKICTISLLQCGSAAPASISQVHATLLTKSYVECFAPSALNEMAGQQCDMTRLLIRSSHQH